MAIVFRLKYSASSSHSSGRCCAPAARGGHPHHLACHRLLLALVLTAFHHDGVVDLARQAQRHQPVASHVGAVQDPQPPQPPLRAQPLAKQIPPLEALQKAEKKLLHLLGVQPLQHAGEGGIGGHHLALTPKELLVVARSVPLGHLTKGSACQIMASRIAT